MARHVLIPIYVFPPKIMRNLVVNRVLFTRQLVLNRTSGAGPHLGHVTMTHGEVLRLHRGVHLRSALLLCCLSAPPKVGFRLQHSLLCALGARFKRASGGPFLGQHQRKLWSANGQQRNLLAKVSREREGRRERAQKISEDRRGQTRK